MPPRREGPGGSHLRGVTHPRTRPDPPRKVRTGLTSLDGMLTTPVDLLFSLSFLFSICPFPFLALGPELVFSLALLGDGLSLSGSRPPAGPGSGEPHWDAALFGWLPAGALAWGASSFGAGPEEDRATAHEAGRQLEVRSGPAGTSAGAGGAAGRLALLAAGGAPDTAAMSPSILALIFSRFAFHSSRKSVAAFGLNPPVAMTPPTPPPLLGQVGPVGERQRGVVRWKVSAPVLLAPHSSGD